jgi:hypothetical protein
MDDKLRRFLRTVPNARWRSGQMPPVWNEQVRQALCDQLILIGFGGLVKLTEGMPI